MQIRNLQRWCYDGGDLEKYDGEYNISVGGWEHQKKNIVSWKLQETKHFGMFLVRLNATAKMDSINLRCQCRKSKHECTTFCHKGIPCKDATCSESELKSDTVTIE